MPTTKNPKKKLIKPRNPYAKVVRFLRAAVVKSKKGKGSYSRKKKVEEE